MKRMLKYEKKNLLFRFKTSAACLSDYDKQI